MISILNCGGSFDGINQLAYEYKTGSGGLINPSDPDSPQFYRYEIDQNSIHSNNIPSIVQDIEPGCDNKQGLRKIIFTKITKVLSYEPEAGDQSVKYNKPQPFKASSWR